MNTNQEVLAKFYRAFANKDYKGMQDCYAENATFNDAIFKDLNAMQVRAMWQMLLLKSKDMRIVASQIVADEKTGKAHWDAYYTFGAPGNAVVNKVDATFEFENGKIVRHTDHFPFYTWAKQALGLSGKLLGWTGFLRNKVQASAKKNLDDFMSKTA